MVSVIIPVYNAAKHLNECLEGLCTQSFRDWEAICIDDGSTDDSGKILDEYGQRDSRIHVVHQDNIGVAGTRNKALQMVQGDWVTFLDADDAYAVDWLRILTSAGEESIADVVCGQWKTGKSSSGVFEGLSSSPEKVVMRSSDAFKYCWEHFSKSGYLWSCLIAVGCCRDLKFRSGIECKEDGLWLLELIPSVECVVECGYKGYFYRDSDASLSKRKRTDNSCIEYLLGYRDILLSQDDEIKKYGAKGLISQIARECIDSDIYSWLCFRAETNPAGSEKVSGLYREMLDYGIIANESNSQWLVRFPLSLWTRYSYEWPAKLLMNLRLGIVRLRRLMHGTGCR